jgi:hypothetical protein
MTKANYLKFTNPDKLQELKQKFSLPIFAKTFAFRKKYDEKLRKLWQIHLHIQLNSIQSFNSFQLLLQYPCYEKRKFLQKARTFRFNSTDYGTITSSISI